MKKVSTLLVAIFLTVFSQSAFALIDVPTLRLGLGMSPITFEAGTVFANSTKLSSLVTINPMFLWDMPSLRMRLGVHFLADIGSKYGFVSTAGVGFTGILYPMGLSSSREVRDDFSEVIKTRISPYFQFQLTPSRFSVTKIPEGPADPTFGQTGSQLPYFSASVLEVSVGMGLDYPMANDLVLFGGLHYRAAALSVTEGDKGGLKYSGIEFLVGIMTNFY